MALDQPDTIDLLCLRPDGSILLVLAAHIDDREELETLASIQRKLNRYFDCIASGEAWERASEMAGRTIPSTTRASIELRTSRALDGTEGRQFIEHVAAVCREAGVGFEHRVQPEQP